MSTSTDMRYGRQGGGWLPDDYEPTSLLLARHCEECDMPMVVGQWKRHHTCNPRSITGERCTCPPGCTDLIVGDAGRCKSTCVPCRIRRGQPYDEIPEWRRSRKLEEARTEHLEEPEQLDLFTPSAV